jgi:2-dehydro-3-deoxygluconokinase
MRGDSLALSFGGAEANVAIGVVRLGGEATFLTSLGSDDIGHLIRRELRAEGVVLQAEVSTELPTGLIMKSHATPGTTAVSYFRSGSAAATLTVCADRLTAVANASIFHVSGITPALSMLNRETIMGLMRHARSSGVTVSMDVNHRSTLWSDIAQATQTYQEMAQMADILFAGEHEAEVLAGRPVSLEELRDCTPASQIVLKLGERGASVWSEGATTTLPARHIDVVDTVGAGDSFVAGFLQGVVEHHPLTECLQQAIDCGTYSCLNPGDWEGLPTSTQLEAFRADADPVGR